MHISKRISALSPSPTVALNAKANSLRASGVDVLNFGVGEPDFTTPKAVVQKAIESLEKGRTKYGPAGGSQALRDAIAVKFNRDNRLSFEAKNIVCGIGAKELLFHIFLSILQDDDEVLLPAPYWVSYSEQIKAAGASSRLVPFQPSGERLLNISAIDKLAGPATSCFVLNSPNNPAGYILSKAELTELGQYLKDKPWWIVSDEIYEHMSFDKPHHSMLELVPELADRFIVVNGLSKGYAMTGWRVGYCAGPEKVMKMVKSLQSHSSTCIPCFIDDAATHALEQGSHALLAKEIAMLKERRDITVSLLNDMQAEYIKPEGAFYVFIDVRKPLQNSNRFQNSTLEFAEWLLTEHHIALVPGEAFGTPGYLRLSYATSEDTIKQGLKRLATAIDQI